MLNEEASALLPVHCPAVLEGSLWRKEALEMHTFPHKNLVLKCMNYLVLEGSTTLGTMFREKVSTLTEVSPI